MSIKIQYLGARLMTGTSKNTGAEYSMCRLHYLAPAEAQLGKLMKEHVAFGMESKEKDISLSVFKSCEKIKPLSWIEVEVGVDPENVDRTLFTSVKSSQAPAHLNITESVK